MYGDAPREWHEFACPNCAEGLTLHQPDEELPDRLLGTCDGCKTWVLVRGETLIDVTHLISD